MIAFVIGNGVSRKGVDLSSLKGKGPLVGCNEAYKEFDGFDMMASVDEESTQDIKDNWNGLQVYKHRRHVYRSDTGDLGRLPGFYNSGQLALWAAERFFIQSTIYMLGIDVGGGQRLYTGKTANAPTNKCWSTWDLLLLDDRVVNVNHTQPASFKCKLISYKELMNET